MVNFKHMSETKYSFTSKAYSGTIEGSDDDWWTIEFCGQIFRFDALDEAFEYVEDTLFDVL